MTKFLIKSHEGEEIWTFTFYDDESNDVFEESAYVPDKPKGSRFA